MEARSQAPPIKVTWLVKSMRPAFDRRHPTLSQLRRLWKALRDADLWRDDAQPDMRMSRE